MNDNNYNPNEIESKWYKKWECSGVFDSIPNKQKAFTITQSCWRYCKTDKRKCRKY